MFPTFETGKRILVTPVGADSALAGSSNTQDLCVFLAVSFGELESGHTASPQGYCGSRYYKLNAAT
jgi:hypothetical protein